MNDLYLIVAVRLQPPNIYYQKINIIDNNDYYYPISILKIENNSSVYKYLSTKKSALKRINKHQSIINKTPSGKDQKWSFHLLEYKKISMFINDLESSIDFIFKTVEINKSFSLSKEIEEMINLREII